MSKSKMPARIWADLAFSEKIVKNGDCLEWHGYVNPNGYGYYQNKYVHRLAYEEHVGTILPGLTIDHICKNRRCVNPDHLRMMPQKDNTLLGSSPPAMNSKKKFCSNGHLLDGDNVLLIHRLDGTRRRCRICDKEAKRIKRGSPLAKRSALTALQAYREASNDKA